MLFLDPEYLHEKGAGDAALKAAQTVERGLEKLGKVRASGELLIPFGVVQQVPQQGLHGSVLFRVVLKGGIHVPGADSPPELQAQIVPDKGADVVGPGSAVIAGLFLNGVPVEVIITLLVLHG